MPTKPAYCFNRLKGYDAVGFDLDFTLGRYNTLNLMKLIHVEMARVLVHHLGYPKALLDTSFDDKIAQKGLCMDKTNGLLLKLDSDLRVAKASFGRKFLEDHEIQSRYPTPLPEAPELDKKRFHVYNGPWAVPMMSIQADLIEISGLQMESTNPSVWVKLSEDVFKCCWIMYYSINYPKPLLEANIAVLEGHDWTKSPPNYFAAVLGNMDEYFSKCDRLRFIKELREAGFKTFIVTDSRFEFADVVLRFMFGEDYNRLFDIVLTHTMKPKTFFNPDQRFDAAGVVGSDGFFVREEVSEEVRWEELQQFHTYGGGNKAKLTEFLATLSNESSPEKLKVLFAGDSLRSDVKSLKKEERYDWTYTWVQSELESLTCLDHSLVQEYAELNSRTSDWGHMLTAGSGLSYYGAEVKREADFVMSDVLELGGTKNPVKSSDFFELLERSSKTGSL